MCNVYIYIYIYATAVALCSRALSREATCPSHRPRARAPLRVALRG